MVNRHFKDRLFRKIFGTEENRENALSLYKALGGNKDATVDELRITTIENAIYMGMRNDVSFLVQAEMFLCEQQSSYNPNMPLRGLVYLGRLYERYVDSSEINIFSRKRQPIPMPRYFVLYNGKEDRKDETLLLSDSFPPGCNPNLSSVEVRASMININRGENEDLLRSCLALKEYSDFTSDVAEGEKAGMSIEEALDKALDKAKKRPCLGSFFRANRDDISI